MSDGNRLSIQPVWGTNRKLSYGVLDAAENLLQNIDELSDVLDQLTEKYDEAQVIMRCSFLPGNFQTFKTNTVVSVIAYPFDNLMNII